TASVRWAGIESSTAGALVKVGSGEVLKNVAMLDSSPPREGIFHDELGSALACLRSELAARVMLPYRHLGAGSGSKARLFSPGPSLEGLPLSTVWLSV